MSRAAPTGSGWSAGDRVAAFIWQGGFAQVAPVPLAHLVAIPDAMGFDVAVSLLVNHHTVYFGLSRRGRLRAGETLLVLGAAGGIGSAAVQVGKGLGARVIAGVAGHAQADVAFEAGADSVVLLDEGFAVWDTLAIAEYAAEKFADKKLWPQDRQARARARSICAEMHSGFGALRSACGMNIEASLAQIGQLAWRDKPDVRADVQRIVGMWGELLAQHGGPLLFGDFSIADAYFAPVCMRIKTYALPVPADIAAYVQRVCALPGIKAWIDDALAEHVFRQFEEPYRLSR